MSNDVSNEKERNEGIETNHNKRVAGTCAKCGNLFCQLWNEWIQMTGSYYLENLATTPPTPGEKALYGFEENGDPTPSHPGRSQLDGCLLQPLACGVCKNSNHVAFKCVTASKDKSDFNGRIFIKLDKIHLRDDQNELIRPNIVKPIHPQDKLTLPIQDFELYQRPSSSIHVSPTSTPSTDATMRDAPVSLEFADNEAADSINEGHAWKEVHDLWEKRTRRDLSPELFGLRILPIANKRSKDTLKTAHPSAIRTPAHSSASRRRDSMKHLHVQEAPSTTNGADGPQSGMLNRPTASYQKPLPSMRQTPMEPLEAQRHDIDRIDNALYQLQSDIRTMKAIIEDLKRARPSHNANTDDLATLEVLSETVTNVSSKVGEVDGLKMQIEVLKRRLKKVEEASAIVPASSHSGLLTPTKQYHLPLPSVPAIQSNNNDSGAQKLGWNAVNSSMKRKPDFGKESDSVIVSKRPKEDLVDRSSSWHEETTSMTWEEKNEMESTRPRSQEEQKLYRERIHQRPGRPRKLHQILAGEIAAPDFVKQKWGFENFDVNGHYKPRGIPSQIDPNSANAYRPSSFQTITLNEASPGSDDRAQFLRRGSAGGSTGYDPSSMKRTRQKPIRNSEGILIRKDGRPDQRSVSSANNLKKVHARKMAGLDMLSAGKGSPGSPMDGISRTGDSVSPFEGSPITPNTSRDVDDRRDPHSTIMKQMFPYGVNNDTQRMNHAAKYFSPNSSQEVKMQPRHEIIHDDVHQTPITEQGNGNSSPAVNGTSRTPSPHAPETTAQAVLPDAMEESQEKIAVSASPAAADAVMVQ